MKKSILLLTAAAAGLSLAQAPLPAQAAPCFSVIQIRPESLYQSDHTSDRESDCNPDCGSDRESKCNPDYGSDRSSDCAGAGENACASAPRIDVNDINSLLEQLGFSGQYSFNTDCGDALNNLDSCQPQIRIWSNCAPQLSICTPMTPAAPEQDADVGEVLSPGNCPEENDPQGNNSPEDDSLGNDSLEDFPWEEPSAEAPSPDDFSDETPAHEAPVSETPSETESSEPEPSAETAAPVVVTTVPESPTPATPSQDTQTPVEKPSRPDTQTVEKPETASYHAYVLRIVELVNKTRADAGLRPVTLRQDLTTVAQLRAKETVSLFSHTRPNGTSCFTALGEYGVSYRGAGENIAYGQRSPEEVMDGWMNSSGHRANILNANFTSIGVGYYQAANGVKYWSQMFTY